MSFCWPRRSRSRVGCSSSSSSLYDLAEAFCLSPRAQNEDELEAMIDGEAQRSHSEHQRESVRMPGILELSCLSAAAPSPAPVAPAPRPAPAPAPAPAPSTVEVAISSSQQEQLMKRIGVTPAPPSRALRGALRGLSEDDCAVLSHCATR